VFDASKRSHLGFDLLAADLSAEQQAFYERRAKKLREADEITDRAREQKR